MNYRKLLEAAEEILEHPSIGQEKEVLIVADQIDLSGRIYQLQVLMTAEPGAQSLRLSNTDPSEALDVRKLFEKAHTLMKSDQLSVSGTIMAPLQRFLNRGLEYELQLRLTRDPNYLKLFKTE
jgi:hypothetical protein